MASRSTRTTRSSTSTHQRSIREAFRSSKKRTRSSKRLNAKSALTSTALEEIDTPAKNITGVESFPDVTKPATRSTKAGGGTPARKQLTLHDLSGVGSRARKPRRNGKGKGKSKDNEPTSTMRSASADKSALVSHLRSRKNIRSNDNAKTRSSRPKTLAASQVEAPSKPASTQKSLTRTQTPPRAFPKKGTSATPKTGKRKTPSKTSASRSTLPEAKAGEGDSSLSLSDSSEEDNEEEAGATQLEAGRTLSPKSRKASSRTAKGSPKKKLKPTPASPAHTHSEASLSSELEAEYVPLPLAMRSKCSTPRVARSQSTPMTQTQEDPLQEEEGGGNVRPIHSRHSRLVRFGSASATSRGSSSTARRPRSPPVCAQHEVSDTQQERESVDSGSDSDSDSAITVGARTPRRSTRVVRKHGAKSDAMQMRVFEESEVSEVGENSEKNEKKSSKSVEKDDMEIKDDRVTTPPREDNSDILFDNVPSEIVIPKDVLVARTRRDTASSSSSSPLPPRATVAAASEVDLEDLDAQIEQKKKKFTEKDKNVKKPQNVSKKKPSKGSSADVYRSPSQSKSKSHASTNASASGGGSGTQPEEVVTMNPVLAEHIESRHNKQFASPSRTPSSKRHPGWGGSPRVFSPVPPSGSPLARAKLNQLLSSPSPLQSPLKASTRHSRGVRLLNTKGRSPQRQRPAASSPSTRRGLFQDSGSARHELFDPPTSETRRLSSLPTTTSATTTPSQQQQRSEDADGEVEDADGVGESTRSSSLRRSKSSPPRSGRRQQQAVPSTPPRNIATRPSVSPTQVNTPVGARSLAADGPQFQSPIAPPSARSRIGRSRVGGGKATPSPQGLSPSPSSRSRGMERLSRARHRLSERSNEMSRALEASSPSRLSSTRGAGSDAALGPGRAEQRRAMLAGLDAARFGQIRLLLPSSFDLIITKFKAMESFMTLCLSRHKSTIPFDDVKTSVQGTTHREFTHKDLGIIVGVFPEGYELKQVLRTKKEVRWYKENVLSVIAKNCGIEKQNDRYAVVVPAQDQPATTKMNFMSGAKSFNRRHLFRERMENQVVDEHQDWLKRDGKGSHNPYATNLWHRDFPLEKTPLPKPVDMPKVHKQAPLGSRSRPSRSTSVDVLKRVREHALKAAPRSRKAAPAPSSSASNSSSSNTANKGRSPKKKKRDDGDISGLDPALLAMLTANSDAQKELADISHFNTRIRHLKELWTFVRLVNGIMRQKHKTAFAFPDLKSLVRKRSRGTPSEGTIRTYFDMLFELGSDWCKVVHPGPNSSFKNPIFKIVARPGYDLNRLRVAIDKKIKTVEVERAAALS